MVAQPQYHNDKHYLEDEIAQKFQLLEIDAQRRVAQRLANENINGEAKPAAFDFDTWLAEVENFQAGLRAKYGADYRIDVVGLLNELRNKEM